ncbi:tetratricopeptide repeat protein [Rhizobium sp. BK376]|uniref:tetratricopeptide repeat protein n=1 Tax=Rhizobium sp. BK376 TaxID=2512149 RepID=UPI001048B7EB|nr:tetratricopeptide repeat protein [Rhizobium sp. BK376]TCR76792.1 tetratricopeptide repeat protein [Rhizobium sp. BK376]
MADDFKDFDELPKRGDNHEIEEKAEAAFQSRVTESGRFVLQRSDRKDYGTDCQIEIVNQDQASNVRVHVQLKGTERALNADGSLSIEVSRSNFNYLLMQPHSFYAAYHVPTGSLRICHAEHVAQQYEHAGKHWSQQRSLTVTFTDELTHERLCRLADLAASAARTGRNHRLKQIRTLPEEVASQLRRSVANVHVPADEIEAGRLLANLYESNADEIISAAFDQFAAVLGADSDALGWAFMAEVNLGMTGSDASPDRIHEAIRYFSERVDQGRYIDGTLRYTIGNGFSALGQEAEAKEHYEAALADPAVAQDPALASQVHKNLGSSFERLGSEDLAVEHYREALRLNSNLPEAHNALAHYHLRRGEWVDALDHFDEAVFTDAHLSKAAAVEGWKANVLFNNGEGAAAFRQINSLLPQASDEAWIWPFSARLVAAFGRSSPEHARQAQSFWRRYLAAFPDNPHGTRELLLATLFLQSEGIDIGRTYADFQEEFNRRINQVAEPDEVAFLWDRLGHWAQDQSDWVEAERCFRKAYDLAGAHYGYCLGTALIALGRHEESLPIMREQAEHIQGDAMSWFQYGVSNAELGHSATAIEAYEKALALDPDYDHAMFNLGGVYWNRRDVGAAIEIWERAIDRFPDHELTHKLRHDLPQFFPAPAELEPEGK